MNRSPDPTRLLGWLAFALLVACSRDVTLATRGPQVSAGSTPPPAAAEQAGSVAGMAPVIAPSGSPEGPLQVRIQDIRQLELSIVTLACTGDCVEISAVARGGNPPYSFVWDDGSRTAARRVCLNADAALHVAVTDSPLQTAEFTYQPQTASAALRADVRECEAPKGAFCIKNPSFEGTASVGLGTPDSVPPGWQVCNQTPDTNPSLSELPAVDGSTYLGLATFTTSLESAGGEFCAPLGAGQPVTFEVDLAVTTVYALGPARLQVWGGLTPCGMDELLWTSEPVQIGQAWMKQCGVLQPSRTYPYVRLLPEALGAPTTYLALDHFRAAARCN